MPVTSSRSSRFLGSSGVRLPPRPVPGQSGPLLGSGEPPEAAARLPWATTVEPLLGGNRARRWHRRRVDCSCAVAAASVGCGAGCVVVWMTDPSAGRCDRSRALVVFRPTMSAASQQECQNTAGQSATRSSSRSFRYSGRARVPEGCRVTTGLNRWRRARAPACSSAYRLCRAVIGTRHGNGGIRRPPASIGGSAART